MRCRPVRTPCDDKTALTHSQSFQNLCFFNHSADGNASYGRAMSYAFDFQSKELFVFLAGRLRLLLRLGKESSLSASLSFDSGAEISSSNCEASSFIGYLGKPPPNARSPQTPMAGLNSFSLLWLFLVHLIGDISRPQLGVV